MNKQTTSVIAIVCVIALFFIYKDRPDTLSSSEIFKKKAECAKYTELAHSKIKESGRVFGSESYTINEIFYSPSKNSCLYAFTVNTSGGGELYNIYDLFGGDVYVGTIAETFQKERVLLKK